MVFYGIYTRLNLCPWVSNLLFPFSLYNIKGVLLLVCFGPFFIQFIRADFLPVEN